MSKDDNGLELYRQEEEGKAEKNVEKRMIGGRGWGKQPGGDFS